METHRHSLFRNNDDVIVCTGFLDFNQSIPILNGNCIDAVGPDIGKLSAPCLLHDSVSRHHEEILVITDALNRDQRRYLLIRIQLKKIYNCSSARGSGGFRNLVGLQLIDTAFGCENKECVLDGGHQKILYIIVINRMCPLDSPSAAVLCTELVCGGSLDVAKACSCNDTVLVLNQILHLYLGKICVNIDL